MNNDNINSKIIYYNLMIKQTSITRDSPFSVPSLPTLSKIPTRYSSPKCHLRNVASWPCASPMHHWRTCPAAIGRRLPTLSSSENTWLVAASSPATTAPVSPRCRAAVPPRDSAGPGGAHGGPYPRGPPTLTPLSLHVFLYDPRVKVLLATRAPGPQLGGYCVTGGVEWVASNCPTDNLILILKLPEGPYASHPENISKGVMVLPLVDGKIHFTASFRETPVRSV